MPAFQHTADPSATDARPGAGHADCVAYLLKRRANPAAANKQGKTALDVAKSEEVQAILAAALEAPAEAEEAPAEQQPGAGTGKAAHAARRPRRA